MSNRDGAGGRPPWRTDLSGDLELAPEPRPAPALGDEELEGWDEPAGAQAEPSPAAPEPAAFDESWGAPHGYRPRNVFEPELQGPALDLDLDVAPQAPASPRLPLVALTPDIPIVRGNPLPAEATCPKCGQVQPPAPSCVRCGVIFAKLKPRSGGMGSGPAQPVLRDLEDPVRGPQVEQRRPAPGAFARELVPAFTFVFRGRGALWLPLLGALAVPSTLMGGVMSLGLTAAFMGLLATFFAKSMASGIEGEAASPALPRFDAYRSEILYPGLAVLGLSIILFILPVWRGVALGGALLAQTMSALEAASAESASPIQELDWDEVFMDQRGRFYSPKDSDRPGIYKRADGSWVEVIPEEGVLVVQPKGYQPAGKARDELELLESELPPPPPPWTPSIPAGPFALFLLAALLPFLVWPMALTVAGASSNVLEIFNPVAVVTRAFSAGAPYLLVVAVGAVLITGWITCALVLVVGGAVGWAPVLILAGLGQVASVQGYLMGALIRRKPDLFPNLET